MIREVLRLMAEARLSDRQVAAVIGSARSTVQECLRRARAAGLIWPLPPECDDEELHARLYRRSAAPPRYPTPDFAAIHSELALKVVTQMLLWQEYKARHPDGCRYGSLCRDHDTWLGRQDAVMCFEHTAWSSSPVGRCCCRRQHGQCRKRTLPNFRVRPEAVVAPEIGLSEK